MLKRVFYTLIICVSILKVSGQQRALTSTYAFNGLLLNPAYAGSLNVLSAVAVHRQQWLNIDGAPEYNSLTIHNSFYSNQVGVGLAVTNDRVGIHRANSVYGSYAYKIHSSIGVFSMGIQGGFDHVRSNYSELDVVDPGDAHLSDSPTRFSPNVGLGVYFANPYMYAGISAPYIIENKIALTAEAAQSGYSNGRESRYYYFTGGMIFPAGSIKVSPSILIRKQEENRLSYEFTGMVIFEDIAYAGVGVRNSGDLVFLAQFILNENIRVGYSYDTLLSDLSKASTGSHEIMLNYRIKINNYRKHPMCPVYF